MSKKQQKALDHEVAVEAMREPPDMGYKIIHETEDTIQAEAAGGLIHVRIEGEGKSDWGFTVELAQAKGLPYMLYDDDAVDRHQALTKAHARQWARYYAGRLWMQRKHLLACEEVQHAERK